MVQQGLTAMLYFVASDEYDIPSEEDESLSKLDVTLSTPYFSHVARCAAATQNSMFFII